MRQVQLLDHLGQVRGRRQARAPHDLPRGGHVVAHARALGVGEHAPLLQERRIERQLARHRRVDIIIGGTIAQEAISKSPLPKQQEKPPMVFFPTQLLSTDTGPVVEILTQTPVGSSFKLAKIFFPAGEHVMEAASRPELEALIEALKAHPRIRIRVEGHVCCIDTTLVKDALDEQTHEYRLSGNRAHFVAQYLIRSGIDAGRISHIGFGKRFAIVAHESTDEEAAANRRVEIRILEK